MPSKPMQPRSTPCPQMNRLKMMMTAKPTPRWMAVAIAAAFGTAPAQADWTDKAKAAWAEFSTGKVPKQVPPAPAPARSDAWGEGSVVSNRAPRGADTPPVTVERLVDERPAVPARATAVAQNPAAPSPVTTARRLAPAAGAAAGGLATAATAPTVISTPVPGDGWTTPGTTASVRRTTTATGDAFPPPAELPFQYAAAEPTATGAATNRVRTARAPAASEFRGERLVERTEERPVRRATAAGNGEGLSDRFYERTSRQASAEAFLGSVSCTNVARSWEGAANAADAGRADRAYAAYVKLLSACKSERELLGTVYQAIRHLPTEALLTLSEEPIMSSVALQDVAYELRSNLLFRFNRERKVSEAMKLGEEMRDQAVLRKDANVLTVLGYLEMQGKRNERAQSSFRAALRADRDHDKAREGLALTLMAAGKPDAAWREADRLSSAGSDSLKASIRLAQARQAFDNNEPKESLKLLAEAEKLGLEFGESETALRAWSLKQSGQADKASKLFAQLNRTAPDNKEYATGLVEAYRTAGEFQKIEKLSESVSVVGPIAQSAIADQYTAQGRYEEASAIRGEPVEGNSAPTAGAMIAVRTKSGEAGAGRLTITSAPEASVSAQVGSLGRIVGTIGSLRLTDGVNDVTAREGRVGFSTGGQTRVSGGLLLTTALGNTRVGGDLAVRRYNAGGYNQVMVARGPVYDSVRSFSGVMGADGFFVGRANETVFSFSGNQTINADWKVDYNLAMGSVTGRNMNSNGFYRAVIGGTHNLAAYGMPWLSAGPQMHVGGYREDQNVFDRAAGGYFSPKSDTGFGLKGYVAHEQSNRLILRGSAYAGYVNRSFNDFSESGVQLEGDVAATYLFNDSLIGTVGTTMRSSPGYSDAAFWLAITVPFEKRTTLNARDVARPALGIR